GFPVRPSLGCAAGRSGRSWRRWPTIAYDGTFEGDTMSGKPLSPERWQSITVPTLVIDGGASETFMHTGADALASVLPNAERLTLEGQTHDVDPEILAPALAAFFR